ncbi:MAG: hypothetical protein R2712_11480 [Vicinamibacterales bacterium]
MAQRPQTAQGPQMAQMPQMAQRPQMTPSADRDDWGTGELEETPLAGVAAVRLAASAAARPSRKSVRMVEEGPAAGAAVHGRSIPIPRDEGRGRWRGARHPAAGALADG